MHVKREIRIQYSYRINIIQEGPIARVARVGTRLKPGFPYDLALALATRASNKIRTMLN